jgi:hypothetical protein
MTANRKVTSDLTHAQWLAARERLREYDGGNDLDALTEAALGCSCPPEPAPEPWRSIGVTEVRLGAGARDVWVGIPGMAHELLTANEADGMALALTECAAYIREQEARQGQDEARERWKDHPPVVRPPPDICGRVLVGRGGDTWDPVCARPKGHPDFCQKGYDE